MTKNECSRILSEKRIIDAQAALAIESVKYSELADKLSDYASMLVDVCNALNITSDKLGDMAMSAIGDCTSKDGSMIAELATRLRKNLISSSGLSVDDLDTFTRAMEMSIEYLRGDTSEVNYSEFIDAAYKTLNTGDRTLLRNIFPDIENSVSEDE